MIRVRESLKQAVQVQFLTRHPGFSQNPIPNLFTYHGNRFDPSQELLTYWSHHRNLAQFRLPPGTSRCTLETRFKTKSTTRSKTKVLARALIAQLIEGQIQVVAQL